MKNVKYEIFSRCKILKFDRLKWKFIDGENTAEWLTVNKDLRFGNDRLSVEIVSNHKIKIREITETMIMLKEYVDHTLTEELTMESQPHLQYYACSVSTKNAF